MATSPTVTRRGYGQYKTGTRAAIYTRYIDSTERMRNQFPINPTLQHVFGTIPNSSTVVEFAALAKANGTNVPAGVLVNGDPFTIRWVEDLLFTYNSDVWERALNEITDGGIADLLMVTALPPGGINGVSWHRKSTEIGTADFPSIIFFGNVAYFEQKARNYFRNKGIRATSRQITAFARADQIRNFVHEIIHVRTAHIWDGYVTNYRDLNAFKYGEDAAAADYVERNSMSIMKDFVAQYFPDIPTSAVEQVIANHSESRNGIAYRHSQVGLKAYLDWQIINNSDPVLSAADQAKLKAIAENGQSGIFLKPGADGDKASDYDVVSGGAAYDAQIQAEATAVRTGTYRPLDYRPDGSGTLEQGTPDQREIIEQLKIRQHYMEEVEAVSTAGDIGKIVGTNLAKLLNVENPFAQVIVNGVSSTIFENIFETVRNGGVSRTFSEELVINTLEDIPQELLANLKSAGIGALSSFLSAELIRLTGIDGVAGEALNSVSGAVINQILDNLISFGWKIGQPIPGGNGQKYGLFDGVNPALIANAAGSFIGAKLASSIFNFQTVGGQIGSSLGSSLGAFVASRVLAAPIASAITGLGLSGVVGTVVASVLTAGIGTFLGFALGGLIGSLFGGTPRSGADAIWDDASGTFIVANVYSKKGGSKEAAKSMADAAAGTFNNVLESAGGVLLNPRSVKSGNYGMRKSDFVYRSIQSRDEDDITYRVSSKDPDGLAKVVTHGVFTALADGNFQIAAGNNFVKRALYNTVALAGTSAKFDLNTLSGNLLLAAQYSDYFNNKDQMNSLIMGSPGSILSAQMALLFVEANELGLTRRHESDWYGGFSSLQKEFETNVATMDFTLEFEPFSGKLSRKIDVGQYSIADTIEVDGQTTIEGTDASETIILIHSATNIAGIAVVGGVDTLASTAGLKINGVDGDGGAISIDIAATIDAGGGDDIVHGGDMGNNVIGGAGNDTLFGGRLDDWILGGDGDDVIHAGAQAGGRGGNGNYLSGGAGNDQVYGREGSDWLEGGDGTDTLDGGSGDDVLAGGAGAQDSLKGGHGDDQYLVRRGDGADTADEVAGGTIVGTTTAPGVDRIQARYAAIAAGLLGRNWFGDAFDRAIATSGAGGTSVAAASAGGEDAIVFGQGIDIGDIRLSRLGGATGADLLIQVMTIDEATGTEVSSGTELVVKDWFADPFKRVEWLKFADGNEIRLGDITSFVVGSGGNDVLIGTDGNDFVYGGAGNDELRLLAGNDIGNGGTGNDLVSGDDGADIVIGGLGIDRLIGGRGRDALSGDGGDDDLYGGADNDMLSGGKGNDQVVGGAGDDIFKFGRGDGRDTIFDNYSAHWSVVWSASGGWGAGYVRNDATGEITAPDGSYIRKDMDPSAEADLQWFGRFDYDYAAATLYRYDQAAAGTASVVNAGTDMIEFALGISIQDIVLTRTSPSSSDLVMTISEEDADLTSYAAAADSITIKNWYLVPGQIEKLAFYQTGVLALSGTGAYNLVASTDANNGTTSTPLAGTAGKDWITGGAGDDVIAGGANDDILNGNSGFDTLRGDAGIDVLYGGSGEDSLDGGDGADFLIGGAGLDTATYASSSAVVRAYLGASWANTGTALGDTYSSIENLAGGTFGGLYPTEKPGDVLGGDEGDNELTGGRGDDRLLGGAGDDTYMWNGADWYDTIEEGAFTVEEAVTTGGLLSGFFAVSLWEQTAELRPDGSGNYWRLQVTGPGGEIVYDWDKFAPIGTAQPSPATWDVRGWLGGFARTNGQQVIREKFDTSAAGGQDVIEMGAGISLPDLIFFRSGAGGFADEAGSGLTIRYGSSLDSIWIKNHYTAWGAVETLQFRDGLSVSLAHVLSVDTGGTIAGTDDSELISADGGTGGETLLGMGGNDVLSGLRGNDVLQGGDGDDVMEGGAGADTLDGGDNSAMSATPGWGDTVRYVKSAAVNVDLRRTTGQLGGEAAGDILTGIENVVGSATGGDTISGDDGGNRIDGLDGNNAIHGWGGEDVLIAGTGADLLYGDDGDDAVAGGEGADQLWGGLGDDRLAGGVGADKLYGEAGKDVLTGGEGDDSVLDGGDGDDDILGEAGNDTLIGGTGDDLLDGGAGNDNLQGGEGNDRYHFKAGSGLDTLTDVSGTNSILLDDDIAFDKLWLTQVNQDLRIAVMGTSDVLTITSFFAASAASLVRSVQTSRHALYLDHPAARTLIAAMTAASAGSAPASMPANIASMLATYWHEGGKAAPVAPAERTISVIEDTPTPIDGSFGVVDQDSNIVSYSVKADAAPAHGTITLTNPATGALTYTPSANFTGEDRFSLIVTDADGQSAEIPIRITVEDVNDAPVALRTLTGEPLAVAEYTANGPTTIGTSAGWLVATDPEGDQISWSLVQDGGGRFEISALGILSVKNPSLLDREISDSHVVRVRATDIRGASTEQDFAVTVVDVNEANAFGPIPAMAIGENSAAGTLVGTVPAATDIDSGAFGEQRYYFWNGTAAGAISPDGLYAIDGLTGAVRVNSPVDLEDGTPSRTYTVIARDNAGTAGFNQAAASLTIIVQDVNEPNALGPIPDMTIAENGAVGTVVGSVPAATDPDGGAFGEQRYYFLSGSTASSISADGRYAINANNGTIITNAALDYEAMLAPGTYTVIARDNQGAAGYNQAQSSVTIRIGDVNETNSLVAPAPFSIGETAAVGTVVGTITATDQDLPGTVGGTQRYYFLQGTIASQTSSDGRYTIDAVTGAIKTASTLDHETMTLPVTYPVIARDNAGGGAYHEAQTGVVIAVADVNEPNSMASSFGFGVDENVGLGTVVGTIVASDPDDLSTAHGQQRFYFLNGATASAISSDGRYVIDSISGTIKTNAALDRETMTAPGTYTVIARDNQGAAGYNQAQTSVTIQVRDLNEANGLAPPAPFTIGENAAVGTTIGTITATDQDLPGTIGGTQRYSFLQGTIASQTSFDGRYSIDAVTGAIKTASALDHETMSMQVTYQVIARDNAGGGAYHEAQTSVVIGVSDVNEPNGMASTFGFSIDENVGLGTAVGTIVASDPDAPSTAFGQQRFYFHNGAAASAVSSDGRYVIDAISGTIKTNAALDHETMTAPATYTVIARDNQGAPGYNQASTSVTIAVANVNETPLAPVVLSLPPIAAESSSTWVAKFLLSDPDGTVPTLRLVSNPDGAFMAVNDEIRFAGGTAPNFETLYAQRAAQGIAAVDSDNDGLWEISLAASIDATDGALSSPVVAGAIMLEDLNEAPISLDWSPAVTSVAERDRVAAGTALPAITLGTLGVTDPDFIGFATGSYNFSVADDRFEIIGTTLRLKEGRTFDFEAGATVMVTVTATDKTGAPLSIQRGISIAVENRDDVLQGDANANILTGQQNRDLIYGFASTDTLDGGSGDDDLFGGAGADRAIGGGGADKLYGEDGEDTLLGGTEGDLLDGGADRDVLYGDEGIDTLRGGLGNDDLIGGAGADVLDGGDGVDKVSYAFLAEGSAATSGVVADLLTPSANTGAAAGDTYIGIENVLGTNLADDLRGNGGANLLEGSDGNDTLEGRGGDDTIRGGLGADTIYGDYRDDAVDGASSAYTDHGGDSLYGAEGNDTLYGGRGNDTLDGGDGDDILRAEHDGDKLIGGTGNDVMYGGTGSDTYVVTRTSGADTIYNYDPTGADTDILGLQSTDGIINDADIWFEQVDSAGAPNTNGSDLKISVIGSTASVTVKNWFPQATNAVYKIEFITTETQYTRDVDVGGLVALMRTKTKPTTTAARDSIMSDNVYVNQWANYWHTNQKPVITDVPDQLMSEDGTLTLTIKATDDITPASGVTVAPVVISGSSVIDSSNIVVGALAQDGTRTVTISPKANVAGVATIKLVATDAGGNSSEEQFTVTVAGVPDAPTISQFAATPGTAGQAGGIALSLNVSFPDTDGSEVHEVTIAGVPAAVTLSAGTYDSGAGLWRLTPAQLLNLKLHAPAGWSQDLSLTATATATENGMTAAPATKTAAVVINAPPTGAILSATAPENAANGTFIANVVGSDPDSGDTLTYTLIDNAGGRFSLSSAGALSVANGSLLNYEAATSHPITVRITDSFGQYKDQALTVSVANVNEQNALGAIPGMLVNENVAVGTVVGTVPAATDPDSTATPFGQQRYYFWNGTSASATSSDGRYAIDAITGQVTTAAALNYEAGTPSATYTVIARDNAGAAGYTQASSTVTIGINNLNEQNSLGAIPAMSVNENVAVGSAVGTVPAATDPDSATVAYGQQRYYFWDGANASAASSDGRYTINATSGLITTAAALNYEAGPATATYTIVARDNAGAAGYTQASSSVTIGINNVNEQNVLGTTPPMSVNENVAVGTVVGTVPAATDPDSAALAYGQQRYYFWNGTTASATSSDGRYAINALNGQITTAGPLNFEAGSATAVYTVIARDNAGAAGFNQASTDVTIGIVNVNEQNVLGAIPSMSVNENVGVGTAVGTVTAATDPDGTGVAFGQQRYYFWDGANAGTSSWDGRYVINAITGLITTAAALNYEAGSTSVTYTVVARDNAGAAPYNQASSSVTIGINDVNEPNALGTTPPMTVSENVAVGTVVGTVPAATDPDNAGAVFGQQRYYFWNGSAASATSFDGRYAINAITGQITTAGTLNYEAGSTSVNYTVVARDNAGATGFNQASSDVLISILNVNEQNSLAAIPAMSVNENVAVGTVVGTVPAASDPDGTAVAFGQQRYAFWDGANASVTSSDGRYMIDAASGQITTATALNFEAGPTSAAYTIVARDNAGAAGFNQAFSNVTIGINNLNEAPGTPAGPEGVYFDETGLGANPANDGVTVATFGQSDPDGTTPTLQFASGGNPNNWFTIVGNQVRFNPGLNFDFEWARAAGYAIGDWNGDGRAEARVATVAVYSSDGQLISGTASTHVYIQDVNERPNALTLQSQTFFSETVAGDTPHSWQPIAQFGLSDPDQTIPTLQIVGGNNNGWFTTSGNQLTFTNANFTADWLRSTLGQYGQDGGFYYDNDGDGLLEIRVATLTLAAVDSSGAQSDPFTYNVFIEDKNERPSFAASPFTFAPSENAGWYQFVGQVQGSDIDGPASELRYLFASSNSYWDGNLGRQVSASADGRFVMDSIDGRVWVNGNQALDFEATPVFSYQTAIYDKALGTHSLANSGTLNINLQDVNEPHALQAASFTVNEASSPLGPMTPVPTTGGTAINLRSSMLSDPENRNMHWQFSDGSTTSGPWQIEQDGTLRMMAAVDYETMADWYEEHEYYDWESGQYYTQWDYMGRDPSRAVFNLAVQAVDDSTGVVREANLTLNIADVNEMPTFGTYVLDGSEGASSENQVYQDGTGQIRVYRRTRARFARVWGSDPDGKGIASYQILGGSPLPTSSGSFGTDSNLASSGTPQLWIDGQGYLSMYVPGDSKNEWRGGVNYQKVTLTYTFTVRVTDVDGGFSDVPMTVTMYQRNIDIDPIVIDLDGDGLELVEINASSAAFDMDGDGVRDATGWVGGDDGLLVLDRNGNGAIDDISEISFRTADGNEASELEGLMRFDTNANGFFDAGDEEFSKFQIWRDSNGDGVTDEGELHSLGELGISMINLTRTLTGQQQEGANTVFSTSQFVRPDGTTGLVGDVFFIYEPSDFDGLAAPIVFDYDGDGSGLVSPGNSLAAYDMDGDGTRERTGWIAAGDALLALDRNGDGRIAGIAEISFIGDRAGARTDLEGLAAFDSNGDGVIDTHDSKFADFKLWFDNNGNGVSDTGEVLSLTEAGIREFSLTGQSVPGSGREAGDNIVYATAAFTRDDGSTGSLLDAAFAYASSSRGVVYSNEKGEPPLPAVQAPAEELTPPAATSELTQALAAGVGDGPRSAGASGLSFDLPPGVDPFDVFGNPSAAGGEEARPQAMDLVDELRLAHMVQQMAGFGRSVGENEWNQRARPAEHRYDYFA